MTSVRATGSAPITAASSALGLRPAPVLRGAFGAAAFFAGAAFLAGAFFAAAPYFAAGSFAAGVLPAAVLRGGNLLARGSNSKVTLPSSLFHARNALNARRVRIDTNLSSRSVLPVSSNWV